MARTADYTIQGFLYQFNKTLLTILSAGDDAEITVEGIIEDIDIKDGFGCTAIQCKYHEAQQDFALSLIYKPILQMMSHFRANQAMGVNYVLYAYFPNKTNGDTLVISSENIDSILSSQNKELKQYTDELKGQVNVEAFLQHFRFEFAQSLDILVESTRDALQGNGFSNTDVETLVYPNAIQEIANLSIKHAAAERLITKARFLERLRTIKTTAVSKWTLALKSRAKILEARRKQLKTNLNKNARLRYFLIFKDSIQDFSSNIVLFISDYLDKYHFKSAHICTPLICLECAEGDFKEIRWRLHKKGIVANDGFVADNFDKTWFLREPVRNKTAMEFRVRLLRCDGTDLSVLNVKKCDDLFLIGDGAYEGLDTQDVNVERLAPVHFQELKYLLGVCETYD